MAQGRCSAMLTVALLLVSAATVAQAASYIVGDTSGWMEPPVPTFYATWAANKTFAVGDTLVFMYNKAGHNVLQVTPTDYTACVTTSTTNKLHQTGNDSIALVSGVNSFLCGIPGHCLAGQKLSVTTAATAPVPMSSPPTAAPAPPNTTAPANAASVGNAVTVFQVLAAAVTVSLVASLSA